MQFPFNEKEDYLKGAEKDHVFTFVTEGPVPKMNYTNKDKEERQCVQVAYPQGTITSMTVYQREPKMPPGRRFYHTPLATEPGKLGKVVYIDVKTGEMKVCTSKDWFTWLGEKFASEKKVLPGDSPELKAKKEAMLRAWTKADANKEK